MKYPYAYIDADGKKYETTRKKAKRLSRGLQKRPNRGVSHDLKRHA